MRKTILPINPANTIVDKIGRMTSQLRLYFLGVELNGLIIGDGTPEAAVEAEQGQQYMDENGIAGSVLFIKQQSDIGGDKSQGWVAIG